MNRIDELIRNMCPDGVPHLPLRTVCADFIVPMRDRPKVFDGDIPWCRIEDIDHMSLDGSRSGLAVSKAVVRDMNLKVMPAGTVVASCSASLGTYAIATRPLIINQTFIGLVCGDAILNRFLLHVLHTKTDEIRSASTTGTISYVSRKKFEMLVVPVPPIEVQRQVVEVLDAFMELETELEMELEARRRQYAHYRDQLLAFPADGVARWRPLGEVATIVRGASPRPIQRFLTESDDGVPWIKIGDVAASGKYITTTAQRVTREGAVKSRRISPGDFVLTNSMSFGRPYISKIEGCIHDGWLAISEFNDAFVPDFLFHLLRSAPIQAEFARRAGDGGAVSNLNSAIVRSVLVPVPSIEEQQRIVEILDKFELIVNDLSSGLPAEIAARRQQYAYYRDRLLTFKEAVA